MKIGLVGPCASGKSTLRDLLKNDGYQVRHIAQEHSYVPEMWQVVSNPGVLIYLDVSYQEILKRRKKTKLTKKDYSESLKRLEHAREHADLYIETDGLTPEEIYRRVLEFLVSHKSNRE